MKAGLFGLVSVVVAVVAIGTAGCSGSDDPVNDVVDNGAADAADTAMTDDGTPDSVVDVPPPDALDIGVDNGTDVLESDVAPDVTADTVDAAADVLPDATDVVETDTNLPPDPAMRLREAGWKTGDLHMHSTYSDGEDSVATVVAIAEYLKNPDFLEYHPEYVGNAVDFIALTDHRTAEQNDDPAYTSDKVILIRGQEFGQPGHANLFGVQTTIRHDPGSDGVTLDDYINGLDAAAGQGAVRSINHPYTSGILFPWDLTNYDSMEIWNTRWGVSQPGATQADIDAWETAKKSTANPAFRKGATYNGIGSNAQSLKFYEAMLSRGRHIAVVGGSDRHMLFPIGFPATWVKSESNDAAGVIAGIAARHTFVSRTPVSATIEMSMTVDGNEYAMGDKVPIAPDGMTVDIRVRVMRAEGSRIMLIAGRPVASDADLGDAQLGIIVLQTTADSNDFEDHLELTVSPGDWVYPVVWEPLYTPDLSPDLQAAIPGIVEKVAQVSDENYAPLLDALMPYLDLDVVLSPTMCEPSRWQRDMAQCMMADGEAMATFFFPDWIDRVLNVVTENGAVTDWTMGAAGSAVLFFNRNTL